MYLLFLDESGVPGNSSTDNIFVLGGIIIHESFWAELDDKLNSIKRKYGFSTTEEIKWSDIRRYHYNKGKLKDLSQNDYNLLINDLYGFAGKPKIKGKLKLVACVVDKALFYSKYPNNNDQDLYQKALKNVLERFQTNIYDKMDVNAKGLVIMDERDRMNNSRIRAFITAVMLRDRAPYPAIIENPVLSPSDYSSGIQIADFYIGPIYRNFATAGQDNTLYRRIIENFKIKVGDDKMHGLQLYPFSRTFNRYK